MAAELQGLQQLQFMQVQTHARLQLSTKLHTRLSRRRWLSAHPLSPPCNVVLPQAQHQHAPIHQCLSAYPTHAHAAAPEVPLTQTHNPGVPLAQTIQPSDQRLQGGQRLLVQQSHHQLL